MLHSLKLLLLLINDTTSDPKSHVHIDDVSDRLIRVMLCLLASVSVVSRASDLPNPSNIDVNLTFCQHIRYMSQLHFVKALRLHAVRMKICRMMSLLALIYLRCIRKRCSADAHEQRIIS
jgi:hypothetical protein